MNLAVTQVGMVSALGLDARTSCAAARAGMVRVGPLDAFHTTDPEAGEAVPIVVHQVAPLTRGLFGLTRLLVLAQAAFDDLRSKDWIEGRRLGLVIATASDDAIRSWIETARQDADAAEEADWEEELEAVDAYAAQIQRHLLPRFMQRTNLSPAVSLLLRSDQLGFHEALQQARRWFDTGACDCCIIGGVDSYLDPRRIEALAGLGMLKTSENPVGMVPGEASCFITVEDAVKLGQAGRSAIGHIIASHVAKGGANQLRKEVAGDALALVASQFLASLPDQGRSTGLLVANLNGTAHRAQEVGQMFVRALTPLGLDRSPMWVPALSFGEIGAATGPAAIAMFAQGRARGYVPSGSALVFLMSDDDTRGCFSFSPEVGNPHGRSAR